MKLTQWHDGSVKPVHEGVYERDLPFGVWKAKFRNGKWLDSGFDWLEVLGQQGISKYQNCRWRGLATKPRSQP
jgi:hypothetical protein